MPLVELQTSHPLAAVSFSAEARWAVPVKESKILLVSQRFGGDYMCLGPDFFPSPSDHNIAPVLLRWLRCHGAHGKQCVSQRPEVSSITFSGRESENL